MNTSAIVEAIDVTKTYDTGSVRVRALDGVTLSVERGEMVTITGPSRCGKTTLLNCLSGLDAIDEGEVPARRASRVYPAEALRYE